MSDLMDECKKAAQIMYDAGEETSVRWLALEWAADNLVASLIDDHLDLAWKCMDRLNGYDKVCQFEYNDLDCHAYRVIWDHEDDFKYGCSARAFVHTCQNYNMLYVLHESPNAKLLDEDNNDRQLYVYSGYHDYNFKDNDSLEKLIANGGSRYQDSRDSSYICNSRNPMGGKAGDYSIGNVSKIKMAMFNLETLDCGLDEEQ